ncbi:hypothetical protein B0H12DRAFT_277831 [Mycena haematopus]|nr:hypothetical protein B0H12DRAFT_277831 [Mycena haematopus]
MFALGHRHTACSIPFRAPCLTILTHRWIYCGHRNGCFWQESDVSIHIVSLLSKPVPPARTHSSALPLPSDTPSTPYHRTHPHSPRVDNRDPGSAFEPPPSRVSVSTLCTALSS